MIATLQRPDLDEVLRKLADSPYAAPGIDFDPRAGRPLDRFTNADTLHVGDVLRIVGLETHFWILHEGAATNAEDFLADVLEELGRVGVLVVRRQVLGEDVDANRQAYLLDLEITGFVNPALISDPDAEPVVMQASAGALLARIGAWIARVSPNLAVGAAIVGVGSGTLILKGEPLLNTVAIVAIAAAVVAVAWALSKGK